MGRTRVSRRLEGYRARAPADREAICLTLVQLSQLVVDLPEGSTLEATDALVRRFEDYLRSVPEVTNFVSYTGISSPMDFNGMVRHYYLRRSPNLADIQVNLAGKGRRKQQSHAIAKRAGTSVIRFTFILSIGLGYGSGVLHDAAATAIGIANRIAPEHLELQIRDPFGVIGNIRHAGAVFVGNHTPEPVGGLCISSCSPEKHCC